VVSLPEVLLDWRTHGGSVSVTRLAAQAAQAMAIARQVMARDLPPDLFAAAEPLLPVFSGAGPVTPAELRRAIAVLRRMVARDAARLPGRAGDFRLQAARILIYGIGGRGIGRRRVAREIVLRAPELALAAAQGWLAARRRAA
jgi:hypothetical protein